MEPFSFLIARQFIQGGDLERSDRLDRDRTVTRGSAALVLFRLGVVVVVVVLIALFAEGDGALHAADALQDLASR